MVGNLSAICSAVAALSKTRHDLACQRAGARFDAGHFLYESWTKVWQFIQRPSANVFYSDPHAVLDDAVRVINAYVKNAPQVFTSSSIVEELRLVGDEPSCISASLLAYYTWQYWAPVNVEETHTVRAGLHLVNLLLTDCGETPGWADAFTTGHHISLWIIHYALYSRVLLEYMEGDLAKPPDRQLPIGQADIASIVKADSVLLTASRLQRRHLEEPSEELVVDLGMDRGQDTLYFLSLNYTVHAVDANPTAIRSLHFNKWFKLKVALGDMVLYNFAVVRNVTKATAEVCEQEWEMSHVLTDGDSGQCKKVQKVKAVTCAQLIRRVISSGGTIRFMKIDIQGHDIDCLATFHLIPLQHRPPLLQVEGPFDTAQSVISAIEALEDLGYGSKMKAPLTKLSLMSNPNMTMSERVAKGARQIGEAIKAVQADEDLWARVETELAGEGSEIKTYGDVAFIHPRDIVRCLEALENPLEKSRVSML